MLRYPKDDPAATRNNATYLTIKYSRLIEQREQYVDHPDYTYNIASNVKDAGGGIWSFAAEQFMPRVVPHGRIQEVYFWTNFGGDPSGLHYDVYDNLNLQLTGRKTIFLAPPGRRNFYAKKFWTCQGHTSEIGDIHKIGDISRFPRFVQEREKFIEVTLHAGEMVFLPTCWWHQVHARDAVNTNLNFWWRDEAKLLGQFPAQLFCALWTMVYRKARKI